MSTGAIYIGGGLEFGKASKGDGITNAPADGGFRVDPDNYSVSSFYLYPMLAFFSSNDKLGFWADLNAGIRTYSITQSKNADASFSMGGIDVGAGVGAIVPAGPMRIIPRLGLTLGYNSATTPKVKELGADVKSGVLGLGTSSYYDDKGTGFSGVLFLGVNGFAMVLPEILSGLASIAVLFHLVRRSFSAPAGLLEQRFDGYLQEPPRVSRRLGKAQLIAGAGDYQLTAGCFFLLFFGNLLLAIFISNYIFKVAVEALFTPVTYAVVGFLKSAESEDYYDRTTNFNPFTLAER